MPSPDVTTLAGCRSCGAPDVTPILSLGEMPLADGLLTPEQAASGRERFFPLAVGLCERCSLVQLFHSVSPELLFCDDYPYYSSVSDQLLRHSRENALELIDRRRLGPHSLVVELASNDGYLLRNFVERGVPVLGIDPAQGPAEAARRIGVPTITDFFGRDLAERLVAEGHRADVIIANNVLAHVPDLNGFVAGIARLLADDGIASIEMPYLGDLVARREFDTIYHEHLCYFSLTALEALFARHRLRLVDVEPLAIHGGSLRLTVARDGAPSAAVVAMLEAEARDGMREPAHYRRFAEDVEGIRERLRGLLCDLKATGATIAAYGAAAKGATLVNYAGIGCDMVDFVVDRSPHKQGKLMPGVHLPIRHPDALLDEMPSHVLLLAWNFRDEIVDQQRDYLARGGRFIVPVPNPEVLA